MSRKTAKKTTKAGRIRLKTTKKPPSTPCTRRLLQYKNRKKLTWATIARGIGVGTNSVRQWCIFGQAPRAEMVARINAYFSPGGQALAQARIRAHLGAPTRVLAKAKFGPDHLGRLLALGSRLWAEGQDDLANEVRSLRKGLSEMQNGNEG